MIKSFKIHKSGNWTFCLYAILMVLAIFSVSDIVFSQSRVVHVGVYQNAPKIFTDADGRPSGIFIDLIEAIAEEEGWILDYHPDTWDGNLKALEEGQIDLMPDVAYSVERDEKYDFHMNPVVESWSYMYATPGSHINRVFQFDGKRVAVLGGSIQETIFKQMVNGFGLHVSIIPVPSLNEAFQLISDGKADAAIANHLFGDYFSRQYDLERLPIVFNAAKLYYATIQGGNSDLLNTIDRYLDAWIVLPNSVYYQILNHYTTKQPLDLLPKWVVWTVDVIVGLLVILGIIVFLLRWQVQVRTRYLAEANRALHDSKLQYRTLFDSAGDAIFLMSQDCFIDCNVQALSMFGCNRDQIIGASPYKFSPPFQPGGRSSEEKAKEKINLAMTEGPQSFEWVHCRKNGIPFSAEVSLNRLELGGEVMLQAIVRDITERKQEEELKNQFLNITSHELKTPLIPIKSQSDLLLDGDYGALNKKQKEAVEMIQKNENHLERLVNDMIDIASAKSNALQLIFEEADIAEIARDSLKSVKKIADSKGIALCLEPVATLSPVTADRKRIMQVMINLLDNALKYTPEKGAIKVVVAQTKDRVKVSVNDTGIGMNKETLEKIFTPFFQADSQLSRKYGGTGLGLSICKAIIEAHGGTIWGESAGKRKGSAFTFTLPLKKAGNVKV